MRSAILQHKDEKKKKELSDKSVGEEMRKAAMETLSRKFIVTTLIFNNTSSSMAVCILQNESEEEILK